MMKILKWDKKKFKKANLLYVTFHVKIFLFGMSNPEELREFIKKQLEQQNSQNPQQEQNQQPQPQQQVTPQEKPVENSEMDTSSDEKTSQNEIVEEAKPTPEEMRRMRLEKLSKSAPKDNSNLIPQPKKPVEVEKKPQIVYQSKPMIIEPKTVEAPLADRHSASKSPANFEFSPNTKTGGFSKSPMVNLVNEKKKHQKLIHNIKI